MSLTQIKAASSELAQSLCDCFDELRGAVPSGDSVYAFALVVMDDFSSLMAYANTTSHLASSNGGMLDKWYFAEWWSEGMEIDAEPLLRHLGGVEDFDEEPESGNAPQWLTAMTEALRTAKQANCFVRSDTEPTLFCSMVDSLNAVWLESVSARSLNAPAVYKSVAPELRAAAEEWYGEKGEAAPEFRAAYEQLLSQLRNSP